MSNFFVVAVLAATLQKTVPRTLSPESVVKTPKTIMTLVAQLHDCPVGIN